jgi:hypothetical protein
LKAEHYRALGWIIFGLTLILALHWCLSGTGLAGWLMDRMESATGSRLTMICWVITVAIVGFPGYLARNYFEKLAWDAHVKTLPKPNRSESARRSKYIQTDAAAAPAPKIVPLAELPKGQQEYIATCPACGNFFSAKADDPDAKCPNCGEALPGTPSNK